MWQVFASVVANRNNGPELIVVMTKIRDTQCYSLILERLDKLEQMMGTPSLEDEIASAIARGCQR